MMMGEVFMGLNIGTGAAVHKGCPPCPGVQGKPEVEGRGAGFGRGAGEARAGATGGERAVHATATVGSPLALRGSAVGSQFTCREVGAKIQPMDVPMFYENAEGHAVLRPTGTRKMAEVVDMVTDAISYARAEGARRLLVVLTAATGMVPPRVTTRYGYIREWARVSGGLVRVALVTTAEMMESDKFGVTVAANAGMVTNFFEDEAAALAWLLG